VLHGGEADAGTGAGDDGVLARFTRHPKPRL
jgi:hypothetical protein